MIIEILYEDNELLAINKPAGLLVHPIPGGQGKTLIDWLRDRYPGFEHQAWPDAARPGIVHRLDRDTSGVMVVAKNPMALGQLQKQFADRHVQKTYLALVVGTPDWQEQTVIASVDRSGGTRRKASFLKLSDSSKDAETHFRLTERLEIGDQKLGLMVAEPKTGRTHQIRVHLGLLGYPILGDPWYQTKLSRNLAKALAVPRLLLHAKELMITQPETGEQVRFQADLPQDFQQILDRISNNR